MATYVIVMCDQIEALEGEGYALSGDSFNPDNLLMSSKQRHCAQQELDDYTKDLPTNPSFGDGIGSGSSKGMGYLLLD